ncbi:Major Facilitator Superfamily protein [Candidatus Hepatincolaceae symbiont of Richtersius coronifer]
MKLKISLLSIFATVLLIGTGVSPMLPEMAQDFGGEAFAKLFLTLPFLIIIPMVFLSGFLSEIFAKKTMINVGLILYLLSGLGGILAYDQTTLLLSRSLIGIGAGIVIPYSTFLVGDYFKNAERDKILSYTGVVSYLTGIVILFGAGYLATFYWKLGFLVFLLTLLPLFLINKHIPDIPTTYLKKRYPYRFTFIFNSTVYRASFCYFFVTLFVFTYFSELSFLISSKNLGSTIAIGAAQSIMMAAGVVSNLLMTVIKKVSIYFLCSLQMFFVAQGFFALGTASIGIHNIYFGSFLLGIGFGSFASTIMSVISESTTRINRLNAIAVAVGLFYLAQFISPWIFSAVRNITRIKEYSILFSTEGVLFTFIAILCFYIFIQKGKQKSRRTKIV